VDYSVNIEAAGNTGKDRTEVVVLRRHTIVIVTGSLSDAAFETALAGLGFNRLLDVVATVGFYTAVSLTVNVFEVEPNPDFPSTLEP